MSNALQLSRPFIVAFIFFIARSCPVPEEPLYSAIILVLVLNHFVCLSNKRGKMRSKVLLFFLEAEKNAFDDV